MDPILGPISKEVYFHIYSTDGDRKIKEKIQNWSLQLGNKPLTLLFQRRWWYGYWLRICLKKKDFKTRLFHFVDVFPTLRSKKEVSQHLREYFIFSNQGSWIHWILRFGFFLASFFLNQIRKNIIRMANLFIAGRNLEEASKEISKILKKERVLTLDLLGEFTLSEREALRYQFEYLSLLEQLSIREIQSESNSLYKAQPNISIKLTALFSQINETAWEDTVETLVSRVEPIFKKALQKKCFISIDVEKYQFKDLAFDVFKKLTESPFLKDYPYMGIVLQAYLKDSVEDAKRLVEWGKKRGVPFTIRLVKGAYWDFEVHHALDKGWPIPVFERKSETDLNFERLAAYLFKNKEFVRIAIASHNMRSLGSACYFANQFEVQKDEFEIQMLYGMADGLKEILTQEGYFVREYVPIGEMLPGMSYLVRRLLENTANESFLRLRYEKKDVESDFLIQNPFLEVLEGGNKKEC